MTPDEAVVAVAEGLERLAKDKPTLAKLLLWRFAKACGMRVLEQPPTPASPDDEAT